MGLGPLGVRIDVLLQPGIALSDGPVVHVVLQIGSDERQGRQLAVVRGPGALEWGQELGRNILEKVPRSVVVIVTGITFDVGAKSSTGLDHFAPEVWRREGARDIVAVLGDALV